MCRFIVLILLSMILDFYPYRTAEARNDMEGGVGLGAVTGTPGSNKFAEIFYLDWSLSREQRTELGRVWTSVGPMVQLVAPGSYTQVAGAIVTKFHWFPKFGKENQNIFGIVPLLGLGGVHTQLKSENASTLRDMSYYATTGLSLDFNLIKNFGASLTYMHNFHHITLGNGHGPDSGSDGFFFSVRFSR